MAFLKKTLFTLLRFVVTGGVIAWIIHRYGWTKIWDTVSMARPGWLLSAVLLFIASMVLGAWQWRTILKNRGVTLPLGGTIRLYFIGIFFNNFILGMVAGDAYRVSTLHMDRKAGSRGVAATFLDRLAGLLSLSVFAIVGGLVILRNNIELDKQFTAALLVLGLFVVLFLGVLALLVSRRLQTLARGILLRLPAFPGKEGLANLLDVTFLDRRSSTDGLMILQVVLMSTVVQSMRITVHVLCAFALGMPVAGAIHYFFVIVPIIALLMIIPLPFGVREAVGGTLFGLAGFDTGRAVIMEFLATLVGIGGSLVGAYFFLRRRKQVTAEEASPSA